MKKLLSRKLFVAVGAIATAIYAATTGGVPWAEALPSIAAIVVGYCAAQGWIDAKEIERAIHAEESGADASADG
jgi:hypothetical protein